MAFAEQQNCKIQEKHYLDLANERMIYWQKSVVGVVVQLLFSVMLLPEDKHVKFSSCSLPLAKSLTGARGHISILL